MNPIPIPRAHIPLIRKPRTLLEMKTCLLLLGDASELRLRLVRETFCLFSSSRGNQATVRALARRVWTIFSKRKFDYISSSFLSLSLSLFLNIYERALKTFKESWWQDVCELISQSIVARLIVFLLRFPLSIFPGTEYSTRWDSLRRELEIPKVSTKRSVALQQVFQAREICEQISKSIGAIERRTYSFRLVKRFEDKNLKRRDTFTN